MESLSKYSQCLQRAVDLGIVVKDNEGNYHANIENQELIFTLAHVFYSRWDVAKNKAPALRIKELATDLSALKEFMGMENSNEIKP